MFWQPRRGLVLERMANDSAPVQDAAKTSDRPLRYEGDGPAARSYAWNLRHGLAKGFAVCAKPLRFAQLPDVVVTAYAEIGEPDCCYVFESQAEARRRLDQIPPENRLGWIFSILEVSYQAEKGSADGPTLDVSGHPFAMRIFVVEKSGEIARWEHGGHIGWRGAAPNLLEGSSEEAAVESVFDQLQAAFSRRRKKN